MYRSEPVIVLMLPWVHHDLACSHNNYYIIHCAYIVQCWYWSHKRRTCGCSRGSPSLKRHVKWDQNYLWWAVFMGTVHGTCQINRVRGSIGCGCPIVWLVHWRDYSFRNPYRRSFVPVYVKQFPCVSLIDIVTLCQYITYNYQILYLILLHVCRSQMAVLNCYTSSTLPHVSDYIPVGCAQNCNQSCGWSRCNVQIVAAAWCMASYSDLPTLLEYAEHAWHICTGM